MGKLSVLADEGICHFLLEATQKRNWAKRKGRRSVGAGLPDGSDVDKLRLHPLFRN
jgi:hypothetical protein